MPRRAVVLLVEDNEDHAFLAYEALSSNRLLVDMHRVDNGVKCMQFLRREAPYPQAPEPDLILLDIHLPLMDGFEVMAGVREDPRLKFIPVVVMSTSGEDEGVRRMYELGCNSYVTKPVTFEGFSAAMQKITDYWLQLVVLPPHGV
jgi:CheY-like chemotaxis protein